MAKKVPQDSERKLKAAEEARRMAEIIDAKRKIREAERMQQERKRLGTGDEDAKLLTAAIEAKRKLRELGVSMDESETPYEHHVKSESRAPHPQSVDGGRFEVIGIVENEDAHHQVGLYGHIDEGDMSNFEVIIETNAEDESQDEHQTIATGPSTEPPRQKTQLFDDILEQTANTETEQNNSEKQTGGNDNEEPQISRSEDHNFVLPEKDTLQNRNRIRFDSEPWIQAHIKMKDEMTEYFGTFVNFGEMPRESIECPLTFWLNHPKPSRTPKLHEYHETKKRHRRWHEIIDSITAKEFIGANVENDVKELSRATTSLVIALKELDGAMGDHTANHHPGEGNDAYVHKIFDPSEFHGKKWSQEHVTWRVCLIAHTKGDLSPRIAKLVDSGCCDLGKWIDHSRQSGHQFPGSEFDDLVKRHEAFHSTVSEVLALIEVSLDPAEKLRDIIRATSSLTSIIAKLDPDAIV